ncbi:MAG: methionine gamma-lyase family protein [Clostridiales bacterium]|jgi:cystathionine beta-lyase family protein involved in aluminum resistance|nr:methionine gamma-lyase family protein [Clostridiales bacterium]
MSGDLAGEFWAGFGVTDEAIRLAEAAEERLEERFREIDGVAWHNQNKTLAAMRAERISEGHFGYASGYGYGDDGRDALERVFARVFGAESALARAQIISGTHALTVALGGLLLPGDGLLSAFGAPYDTLLGVIGVRPRRGSLAERGVTYRQVEPLADGAPDYPSIASAITPKTRVVLIQRSRGYSLRRTLTVAEIGRIIACVKSVSPYAVCVVDNCYGEFTERGEPCDAGADLSVGSLIKNPGGCLAPVGGYIAGKTEYVERVACVLTAPGLGAEVGPSLGMTRLFAQGLFAAPSVTAGCLKGAALAAEVFARLGYGVSPGPLDTRSDIVQTIVLGNPGKLTAFCRAIQAASPVGGDAAPEPWPMPGYDCDIIMAAGGFVSGSSAELSADAPVREPYAVYLQGGMSYYHIKTGVLAAACAVGRR